MMQLIDQVKKIETYICEYFEDWDLDNPVEEEYLDDYQNISGASEEELQAFEEYMVFVYLVTSKSFIATKMGVNTSLFYLV